MLVLTRKIGESIKIGDSVEVKVLEVHRGRIRLGIDAPRDIKIVRSKEPADVGVAAG